jgi:hypothetical protein
MCETSFEADLPDRIDLDSEAGRLDQILGGSFFSLTCPSCGKLLKPELDVRLSSAKRGLEIQVLPELDRLAFMLGQVALPKGVEILIGYPELVERARMMADGLDPETLEIIKYYLRLKAEDRSPEATEISVCYSGFAPDAAEPGAKKLSFHVKGIKEGETAVLPVSMDYYEKIRGEKKKKEGEEPFKQIFKGPYRSIRVLEAPSE